MIVAGIPAYNEEKTIAKVILEAQKHVDAVIVCDDGSQDMTAEIAQRLGAVVVRHDQNLGYGSAMISLFEKARALNADLLVTLDADGQHNAEEIQMLVQSIAEGKADVAIGSRFLNRATDLPMYRRFGIKLLTRIANGNKEEPTLTDAQCGFRAYNKRAIENLDLHEPGMGVSVEILRQARKQGMIITEVPIAVRYHDLDTSSQDPIGHGMSVLSTIIEERPMVYLGVPALFALLVGVAFGVWTLYLYSIEGRIVTNVFLISIGLTLSGMFTMFTAITLSTLPDLTAVLSKDTSTHPPVKRGISIRVLSRIIKLVIEENPLTNLGVPAIFALLGGIAFGMYTLSQFFIQRYMNTSFVLISIGLTLSGMFALFTAITLSTINRAKRKIRASLK